ncbi:lysine 2,3-aminomutase YodO family protein [Marinobacter santoriniensis NKSG1]|uniref:L-lysine 2,3-aminomutase n=1 Tax=Marinobacter santoriniensis NKSG1 TaxID=1288826 RepID=M7DEH5_9GAMM|nr:EF-P beta-lysylation protein EpmB [Marinobacter santoriniensis]EMP56067.1 lysine 2,3-aminomutase YodO family protein [Marinobacter santoriniensis NKSG1]
MIQRTPARIEAQELEVASGSWQTLLSRSITTPESLLERLGLDPQAWFDGASDGHRLFPIRVPEPFLMRMEYGNARDPLLLQVLPRKEERENRDGFVRDPLAENEAIQTTGLIRKYRSRALLMVTGQCAINCRYCFRRHFPYDEQRLTPEDRQTVLRTLEQSPELNEVIFSGGDPLAVNDRLLSQWARDIARIPHIRRLRIHTRLPVVIPQRVCDTLLQWIRESDLQIVIVLHANHPAELDEPTYKALADLRAAGATLLNQSVILRDVNDCPQVLASLSERLFDAGVMPYYLHAFDPVAGAHHFNVSDDKARHLVRELLDQLPGFLVPKLVREIPGRTSKTPLDLFP